MTAQILHIRDYKSKEERELEIDRMCLAAVEDALEARCYEHLCDKPFGSYRGSHLGVPCFEVDELQDGDCA